MNLKFTLLQETFTDITHRIIHRDVLGKKILFTTIYLCERSNNAGSPIKSSNALILEILSPIIRDLVN